MLTARRRLRSWAIVASIVAHLGLLTAVLLQHPTLSIPIEPGGPPVAIIPLLILPRVPATAAGPGSRPAQIQLHRRPQRTVPADVPVAPLVVPTTKPASPAPPTTPSTAPREAQTLAPAPDAVRATLRTTLGCTDARMAGLSREERAGCLERLGRGARDAPFLAQPMASDKRAGFEEAGAAKLAARAWLDRAAPVAAPGAVEPETSDYDGEAQTAHNTVPPSPHPYKKGLAKVPPRLPP